MKRLAWAFLLIILAAAAQPRGAPAQNGNGGSPIEVARAQLELIQPDTAAALLLEVLDRQGPPQEQLRAWTLLGVAELMRGRQQAARFALRRALERDPQLRVDSLGYLHSDLRRVFAAERENVRLDTEPPALIGVRGAVDTLLTPAASRLQIEVAPRRRVRLTATITPNGRNDPIWSDDQVVNGTGMFEWDLTAGGVPVQPGRYLLRVQAADPLGRLQPATRTLLITRNGVDTLGVPELDQSELLPDSVPVRAANSILAGAALGVGTLALASLLGNDQLQGGGGSAKIVVAGSVSVAAIVGFLNGRQKRYSPANAMYNDEVIARHNARVMEINDENQRRLASAGLRVRLGTPRGGN